MPSQQPASVARRIRAVFAKVEPPPAWCLVNSHEGDEPARVAAAFKGKRRWDRLAPAFLDAAPDGLGSALSFFSDEAFRFYLPGYMIADLHGRLESVDPVFHLTHGLTAASRTELLNPRRYGARTWFDQACHRFSVFTRPQAGAIVSYLRIRARREEADRPEVEQALASYWLARAR